MKKLKIQTKNHIFGTNVSIMKKPFKKYLPPVLGNEVSEPGMVYPIQPGNDTSKVLVKDFTYHHFKKIMERGPFTLSEWANMLFMSERTLHRYAKDNGSFNGLQIERILLLESFIDMGNELFGKEGFKTWLRSKPFSLGGEVVQEKLLSHSGIQDAIDILGRLQFGITA